MQVIQNKLYLYQFIPFLEICISFLDYKVSLTQAFEKTTLDEMDKRQFSNQMIIFFQALSETATSVVIQNDTTCTAHMKGVGGLNCD